MTELLYALIPSASTAVFAWLWRKARVERKLAEIQLAARTAELTVVRKATTALRDILDHRNKELKDCRAKLPANDRLDDFFDGLPKGDPGRDNN
jgi:hypothetical protein